MKKATLFAFIIPAIILTGCNKTSSLQEQYDALLLARDTLLQENNQLKNTIESQTVRAQLSGAFVATVRMILPDYCLDDSTPAVAVVTCFQSLPFTVYLGAEQIAGLTVNETYFFEIKPKDIGELPLSEFEKGYCTAETAIATYNARIASYRLASVDELGISMIYPQYTLLSE